MIDLVFPKALMRRTGQPDRIPLTITREHSASSYGFGVLLWPDGQVLDGNQFRTLRDWFGAVVVTDDPKAVRLALGVPRNEPGIVRGTPESAPPLHQSKHLPPTPAVVRSQTISPEVEHPMSRYQFIAGSHTIVVGWDNQLQTHYAQAWKGRPESDANLIPGFPQLGPVPFGWFGTRFAELPTVDHLVAKLKPHAEIPSDIVQNLRRDLEHATKPTALRREISEHARTESPNAEPGSGPEPDPGEKPAHKPRHRL